LNGVTLGRPRLLRGSQPPCAGGHRAARCTRHRRHRDAVHADLRPRRAKHREHTRGDPASRARASGTAL